MQRPLISDFKFHNLPRILDISVYQDSKQKIVEYFKNNEDVISIYEYGTISSPGISDLDIILVLKDKIRTEEHYFDFKNISQHAKEFVSNGNVLKMPENIFKNILHFDDLNTNLLSGLDIIKNLPNQSSYDAIKLISVVDWLPERILRLKKILDTKVIDVTTTLCVLHSFKYSIIKVNKIIGLDNYSEVLDKISKLRQEWFKIKNPYEILIQTIHDALILGQNYLKKFENYLINVRGFNKYKTEYGDEISLEIYPGSRIQFNDVRDNGFTNKNFPKTGLGTTKIIIPNFFYPHFAILANGNNAISKEIRRKFEGYQGNVAELYDEQYVTNLKYKLELAVKNALFLRQNNLNSGLIRYGFHLRG